MDHIEKVFTYFSNNFNCTQSEFAAVALDFGIDEDLALKLTTEFGGGQGAVSCAEPFLAH